MKNKRPWKTVLILIGISIILPYGVALLLHKQPVVSGIEELYSGRTVIRIDGQAEDAEEFLIGVVAAQIPASYGKEAVKAQAVLARTALYRQMGDADRISEGETGLTAYDMTEMEQIWGKNQLEPYYTLVRQAVLETQGETLQYGGTYVEPLYHLASGGMTRPDGSGYYPYLTAVDSSCDLSLPGCTKAVILTESRFAKALSALNPERQIGADQLTESIQVVEKDDSGYVTKMMIGGAEFTGMEVATAAGVSSSCFTIGSYPASATGEPQLQIIARGIGHGYGMSQYGASCYGGEGWKYQEILQYYFQGAEVLRTPVTETTQDK